MSLTEKTEFHFFHVPIFGYCPTRSVGLKTLLLDGHNVAPLNFFSLLWSSEISFVALSVEYIDESALSVVPASVNRNMVHGELCPCFWTHPLPPQLLSEKPTPVHTEVGIYSLPLTIVSPSPSFLHSFFDFERWLLKVMETVEFLIVVGEPESGCINNWTATPRRYLTFHSVPDLRNQTTPWQDIC